MQHARAPGSVIFTDEEKWRLNRAQVALLIGKTPREVDLEPLRDMADVLAVSNANKQIEAERLAKRRRGR